MKLKKKLISASQLLVCSLSLSAAEFQVLTTGDSGGGGVTEIGPDQYQVDTLRSAIELALDESQFPGADQIIFDANLFNSGAVTLDLNAVGATLDVYGAQSNSAFRIDSELTITGPSAEELDLNAGNLRHFQVTGAGMLNLSHVTLSGGQVPNNGSGRGGAIYVSSSAELHLSHVILTDNVANTGGAINIRNNQHLSTISHSTISNNVTTGDTSRGTGGGIFKRGDAPLVISDSTISDNQANNSGGGIFTSLGQVKVYNSALHHNYSRVNGGGISTNNSGYFTLINSTISNNLARFDGGGIESNTESLEQTNLIIGSTIANNHAHFDTDINQNTTVMPVRGDGPVFNSQGGGLFFDGYAILEIHNTLIAGNVSFIEQQPDDIAAIPSTESSFNLFAVADEQIGLVDGVNGNQIGDLATPLDAGLLPLADNGGSTLTHSLQRNSPAVDAGDDAVVQILGLEFDQRGEGFPRQVATVDIGALELDRLFTAGFE